MNRHYSMPGVFVFVLLGLFAVLSTLMVLLGAQLYRATVEHADVSSAQRILTSYVRTMTRGQDHENAVSIEEIDGVKTLAFREDIDGDAYVTRIYPYEGQLRELFTEEAYAFDPEWGEVICPAEEFDPEIRDDLLTVRMINGKGEPCMVRVNLRSKAAEGV